jgi:gliding motility-associated-like protein
MMHPRVVTIDNPVVAFINQSLGGKEYEWDFGDPGSGVFNHSTDENPTHRYPAVGNYVVTLFVSNEYGCLDTASEEVTVEDVFAFYAPNAFTPNGDGINENFIPQMNNYDISTFEFYVYNRWGELIYETNSPDSPWNGRAKKGKNVAQQDVYSWLVYVNEMNGKRHKFVGHVTLLK